jgi:hypothetical protein
VIHGAAAQRYPSRMITSSRRRDGLTTTSRPVRAVLTAAALAAILTACTTPNEAPTPTGSAPPSSPLPTSEPSTAPPGPTPTTDPPTRLTCGSVLDPESVGEFEASGFTEIEDFADRMVEQGVPLARFAANGGVLCQWGVPASGSVENYGLSPITAAEADEEKGRLLDEGYASEDRDEGELLTGTDSAGNAQLYLFTDGFWYHGFTIDRVLEIRRNAALE